MVRGVAGRVNLMNLVLRLVGKEDEREVLKRKCRNEGKLVL